MALTPLFANAEQKRNLIHEKALEGVRLLFPIDSGNYHIEMTEAHVEKRHFSPNDEKAALLQRRSLLEPLYGTILLKTKDGKVVDKVVKFKLFDVPYLTDHFTFIVEGNAYSVSNQLRTKPGVYTRVRRNEVPEVAFNLSKGANFKVTMEPESSIFKMELGTSTIPLYPILKALGMPDAAIRGRWGSQILDANQQLSRNELDGAIDKLYKKLVPLKEQSPGHDINEKMRFLRTYFESTKLDPETTMTTLGKAYKHVGGPTILDASDKLLKVFREEEDHDDRDSLEFQTIHSVEDFVKERLVKGGPEIVKKLIFKLQKKGEVATVRDAVPPSPFNKAIKSLITQFSLSRAPDQINPLEILDSSMKVTRLGDGGISTPRAVPEDTRALHTSHVGIIDPVRTPESSNIGIDVRLSVNTAKDADGNLYTKVKDLKTGKSLYVSAKDLRSKILAFPGQTMSGTVEAIKDGKVQKVPISSVDYALTDAASLFGPSAGLLPFVDNMQGNRATMGSKQITQALPLKDREAPYVQARDTSDNPFKSMHASMGANIAKRTQTAGTVHKISDDQITIKDKSGNLHVTPYHTDLPLNSKTYLTHDLVVKVGDKVKAGQLIADSNFTKGGDVALGRNALVAYMAYHGENTNDAIVVSQGAANKFTSLHMFKKSLDLEADITLDKRFYLTQFPNKYPPSSLTKIENDGVIAKGSHVSYGDPLVLAVRLAPLSATDQMLGRLHTSFRKKYRDISVLWDYEHPGVITEVTKVGSHVTVTVKMEAPAVIGDKLSGNYGNKGVISKIIPDDQMPTDARGRPLDILLAPTGVVSRINPGQLLETALGKVAEKTGQKIVVDNFDPQDRLLQVKNILKAHGISDKETVKDPVSGRDIPGIMVGRQYFYKLFKSTDTNFGARGTGAYDINEQPSRGGEEGSKRFGGMELNALLAHGATSVADEAFRLKGQKNEQWWNAYKLGLPLPPPKRVFITDKFNSMLAGAGINVRTSGNKVQLSALTDKDIAKMSQGTITAATVLRKKDLRPELNGLFDPLKTGGIEGEKWSDITLSEPLIKPAFMKPAASLLRMSETKLGHLVMGKGGHHVMPLLKALKLDVLKDETESELRRATGSKLDQAVKRMKYIAGLERMGMTPHEAYMGSKLAVVPPKMRPIVPGPNNQLLVADSNHLYRDVLLADMKLKEMKAIGITAEADLSPLRKELWQSVSALAGLSEPTSFKLRQQGKKGFIAQIAGTRPAEGFFQEKVYGRAQDLSGRGTIVPDPTLRMDEIGLPEETAKGMYKPFVLKRLVSQGFPAVQAAEHVEKWTPAAMKALEAEAKDRPVIFNRAPSLHRFSLLAAYPKLVPGKTIRINPFVEAPLGADFDGDAIQLHAPVMPKAVEDARRMTLDKLLFSDKSRNDLLAKPEMEAVAGLHEATRHGASGKTMKFKNRDEALQAYLRGDVKVNDTVEIGP